MTNDPDKLDRSIRYAFSSLIYIGGTLIIYAILFFWLHTDPISWPILIALLGGYFLGRLTRGIEL